ncbi:MAG: leucine-rich repeat domain-containing protein [Prevotella sp.]|jgi:hypothetical protein|nr:hypothetical protein [Prevotella sp.]MCH4251421.1 leucine-rich repeat domain-containing protein [Prevotella sp.]
MKKNKWMLMTMAVILLFTAACSDNDGPSYSKTALTNDALKTILTQKGFQFDDQGRLLLDTKADTTTELDLSGTKLDTLELKGLSVLPHLTSVDLSHNGYGPRFDFSLLPEQIKSVNLSNNDIYEYPGLVNIQTAENGDETVTVLHHLTKLILPHSAQYNCVEIPTYFAQVKGLDMEMQNAAGTLKPYTTLRDVPDEATRAYLKEVFPSVFTGDQIDISKRLVKLTEANANIALSKKYIPSTSSTNEIKSVEGVEYIIMNPGYRGGTIFIDAHDQCVLPYIATNLYMNQFIISKVSTNLLNLSASTRLCCFSITSNDSIESADLSHCTLMGTRDKMTEFDIGDPSQITLIRCPKLTSLSIPKTAHILGGIDLEHLPLLKDLNLSTMSYVQDLALQDIKNCKLTFYEMKMPSGWTWNPFFSVDEQTYNRPSVKAFLDKYHSQFQCSPGPADPDSGGEFYDWAADYK